MKTQKIFFADLRNIWIKKKTFKAQLKKKTTKQVAAFSKSRFKYFAFEFTVPLKKIDNNGLHEFHI